MILYLEFDWRGSWRPRRNHTGALKRWIAGPVAVAVTPGGFNDLMGAFAAQVEADFKRRIVERLEKIGTPGDRALDSLAE